MKELLRVAKEARKYYLLLGIAMISTILLTIVNLIAPSVLSRGIDLITDGVHDGQLEELFGITALLLVLYAIRVLFRFLSGYLAHVAAWNLVQELRVKVFRKLQSFSLSYYKDKPAGDLTSRVMIDTENFEHLYAHIIPDSITNILTVVGVSVILFFINYKLALITFVTIPPVLYSGYYFATKVRPNFKNMLTAKGELSAQLVENFSGMKETQVFRQEERLSGKIQDKAETVTFNMLKALKLSGLFHPSVEFLTSLGTVIVVGAGGYLAYTGQIESSEIVTFILYLSLFYAPITGIAQLLENGQLALASVERIAEILDAPVLIKDSEDAKTIDVAQGNITFEDVSFSYTDQTNLLNRISFNVNQGETIAFVGATGAGKTTLINLISRFNDPTTGEIMLDGMNIKEIKLDSLRSNISSVLQDTFLFNGTIAENIAFAKPNATYDEIIQASKAACIHDEIQKMEDGYQTVVGERGTRLSGGQKQRISIARAILHDTPILVLDEATASIDVKTEEHIQTAINAIHGTKTIFVIAHRLSTIRKADKIIVLDNGEIIEQGTHHELLEQGGQYSQMYQIQAENAQL